MRVGVRGWNGGVSKVCSECVEKGEEFEHWDLPPIFSWLGFIFCSLSFLPPVCPFEYVFCLSSICLSLCLSADLSVLSVYLCLSSCFSVAS